MSGGKDDGAPMMEMNMTPLIDVLLVLLIMFIITIPVATHSVDIDLPSSENPPPDVIVEPIINKLVLTQDNRILWNAEEINQGQLVSLLQESRTVQPEPELQFQPEAQARYDLSAKVIKLIKASGETTFGSSEERRGGTEWVSTCRSRLNA